jgi:hypothetical protein
MRTLTMVFCAAAVAACADAGGEWGGTMTDSAGVVLVQNPERAEWTLVDRPDVVEELSIGALDGSPEYQFGQVIGIDVADDGRIFVLDQQAAQVRVFSADGAYLTTIGKPGGGPGELSVATMAVLVGSGDSVYVADMMKQRLIRFAPDGAEAGGVAVSMADGIPMAWAVAPGRRLISQVRPMALPGAPQTGAGSDRLLLRDEHGEVSDTLLVMESGQTMSFAGGTMRMRLFESEPIWTVLNDGRVVHGRNDSYRLEVLGPGRTVERIISKPGAREPVTDADRAAILRLLRETMGRQAPPQVVDQVLQNLEFAQHYPMYARLLGGPSNTLWVQHVRTAERAQRDGGEFDAQDIGAPEWDVFDDEGRLLGTLTLPAKFQPLRIVGDRIYGVKRDEYDVQHVVRLRVGDGGILGIGR